MGDGMTYAVHTESCTYLLDDDGFCRWILSPNGLMSSSSSAVVGAQFIACLDLRVPGGLLPELRVGAAALFVRPDETGRIVMLRTAPIHHVEWRGGSEAEVDQAAMTTRLPSPLQASPAQASTAPPSARAAKAAKPNTKPPPPPRRPTPPPPPPPSGAPRGVPKPPRSAPVVRESSTSSVEETLTLVKPLFRPAPPAGRPAPPAGRPAPPAGRPAPPPARPAPPPSAPQAPFVPVPPRSGAPMKGRPPPIPPPRSIVGSAPPPPPAPPAKPPRAKGTDPGRGRRGR